jgi:hypothetical protein
MARGGASDVGRSVCGSETRSCEGLVCAALVIKGKSVTYLHFLFAKRDFADNFQARSLIRLWILQILCFENVFVFFAVMTWSVGGMMVGCVGANGTGHSQKAQSIASRNHFGYANVLETEERNSSKCK